MLSLLSWMGHETLDVKRESWEVFGRLGGCISFVEYELYIIKTISSISMYCTLQYTMSRFSMCLCALLDVTTTSINPY